MDFYLRTGSTREVSCVRATRVSSAMDSCKRAESGQSFRVCNNICLDCMHTTVGGAVTRTLRCVRRACACVRSYGGMHERTARGNEDCEITKRGHSRLGNPYDRTMSNQEALAPDEPGCTYTESIVRCATYGILWPVRCIV